MTAHAASDFLHMAAPAASETIARGLDLAYLVETLSTFTRRRPPTPCPPTPSSPSTAA